ncbi:hypothetical protein L1049_009869 [Liquidambar formosana]|uniref:Rho termination factor-like N-terminal domain-containing protein n=1 Tax=Liquidambar formosana TaxID=63359 RepID=A0AAP0N7F5_LIQFO
MGAVVFYPHSVFRMPSFFAFSKPKLGKSVLSLKEIADGSSPFASQREFLQLAVSSIRSDGNKRGRPPRKNTASRRTAKEDETKIPQSSDGKSSNSSNQEEIIALFRRIQSSISKEESVISKKRSSNSSEDKPSAESVLEVLRQSRKQVKDKTSDKEDGKVLTQRRGVPKREQRNQDNSSTLDFKLTRPPSNFVKRSPIPSPTTARRQVLELNSEASSAPAGSKVLVRIEEMKLLELKELAKSRGLRGYSKLKKSELLELLRS